MHYSGERILNINFSLESNSHSTSTLMVDSALGATPLSLSQIYLPASFQVASNISKRLENVKLSKYRIAIKAMYSYKQFKMAT